MEAVQYEEVELREKQQGKPMNKKGVALVMKDEDYRKIKESNDPVENFTNNREVVLNAAVHLCRDEYGEDFFSERIKPHMEVMVPAIQDRIAKYKMTAEEALLVVEAVAVAVSCEMVHFKMLPESKARELMDEIKRRGGK